MPGLAEEEAGVPASAAERAVAQVAFVIGARLNARVRDQLEPRHYGVGVAQLRAQGRYVDEVFIVENFGLHAQIEQMFAV